MAYKKLNKLGVQDFYNSVVTHSEALKPFAITLTRDREAARDLYQETMCRALVNHEKYRVGTNLTAWLYTIMRNIFINNYRRLSRRMVVPASQMGWNDLSEIGGSTPNMAPGKLVSAEVEQEIAGLPELWRKPFLLYRDGYRYHEIAVLLSEPLGTVKSRIHFARRQLKRNIHLR